MMRTHDGRINHLQCRVGQAAAGERLQHHIPDATVSPAAELPKNRIPVAELLRQIAPRRAGPHQPKRRVHHTAMVARRTASATDQKRFEIRPLIIGQQSANQGCPPQRAALNQFSIPASIDLSTRPSLCPCHHVGKDQPPFRGASEPSFVAWVKTGLSDFLFGSFSALCGSKHGILGGPARGMQANGWE
jgi:hypothetical protein